MKYKVLLISTIIFFLLINTTYYWEGKLGIFAMLSTLLIIISFLTLAVLLFKQIYLSIKEKFKDKQRIIVIVILFLTLTLSLLFPEGLVNFERFESRSILIAHQEGVANCTVTLKLKLNKRFSERIICFWITETTGNYHLKGDTIFLNYDSKTRQGSEKYKFAIIRHMEIREFKNYSDTIGYPLVIIKNELTK